MNAKDQKQKLKRQTKIKDEKPTREQTNDEEKQYQEDLKELIRLRQKTHEIKLNQQLVADRVTQKQELFRFAQVVVELQKDLVDREMINHIFNQRLSYRQIPFSSFLPFTVVTVSFVHDDHSQNSTIFQPDSEPSFVRQLINENENNLTEDKTQVDYQNSQSQHTHESKKARQND